jgi:hypothetical protein
MDLTTLAIIGAVGLAVLAVSIFMLNRAWGDFPTRAGRLDDSPAPRAAESSLWPAWDAAPADNEQDNQWGEPRELPAGASSENLIPVENPTVKRLMDKALDQAGSPYATYFLRDGERIYFVASRIADPAQRAQAVRVFEELNRDQGAGPNMVELFQTFRQFGK